MEIEDPPAALPGVSEVEGYDIEPVPVHKTQTADLAGTNQRIDALLIREFMFVSSHMYILLLFGRKCAGPLDCGSI